ncbi:excisionase family DNA-binding protein [Nocardioides abyssi]|uniref:Excisionase family DNA-binding protein n=1 Tax=Nocardioides abyssi TaxID=3058370 RepID=A0ABT8EZW0_9ACTN|nr:excisionase family DNA-binding protein [Nocardioides abyssi]MDN4163356.1 excisionase family DNA-binding protein [Nocardioides abyssi]
MPEQIAAALRYRATLTVDETASVLGISRSACYEAIHNDEIPSLRIGRRLVVPIRPLMTLLGVEAADLEDN